MCIPAYIGVSSFSDVVDVTDNIFKFCGYYCRAFMHGSAVKLFR